MQSSSFHFLPPFFLWLAILLGLLIAALQVGILGYAYEKMGISRVAAYSILLASLLGSYVNIPLVQLEGGQTIETKLIRDRWGVTYVRPVLLEWPGTQLAINVGGAVIPAALSLYLVLRNRIYAVSIIGVLIVAVVVYMLAEPVAEMGISVPVFIPPIVSALVAIILSREHAAPLAYVSGCMGTLVGADLFNLRVLSELNASVASIGGAGTFDAVFLTGVLAVLLAGSPRLPKPRSETIRSELSNWT